MREPAEARLLAESRIWPAVLLPAVLGALLVAVSVVIGSVPWYGLLLVVIGLIVAVTRRGNAVLADEEGLLIRTRHGVRRSFRWSQIERMGWENTSAWTSEMVVFPRGGPYDVPGPNAPARPGRVWRSPLRRPADPLPELRARHGIKSLTDP